MPELPKISGDEAIKVFKRLVFIRQGKKEAMSSCEKNTKDAWSPSIKNLPSVLLKNAIKQAGITVDDFIAAYEGK